MRRDGGDLRKGAQDFGVEAAIGFQVAHLDPQHAEVGTEVEIDIRGRRYPFTIVSTPFYSREDA